MIFFLLIMLLSTCYQASDLWQQLELSSKFKSDLQDSGLGQEVARWFQWGKLNLFYLTIQITVVLLMWKWMGLF